MSLITGTDLDDTLSGTSGDDTIQGLGGADSLNGQDGRDLLFGGAGNDRLNGGDLTGSVGVSDDTLDGGAGDDVLFGRRGSDDYRFSSGFGQDEILDNSAASDERDRIVFDATVGRPDILVTTIFDQTSTSDLLLTSTVDGSSIFLDDFISGNDLENGVREIVFADGTVLALDAGLLLNGGDGADDMGSADQADTLDGGGGDDRLNGMGGADLLTGGAGDDTLDGGNRSGFIDSSNDTLIGGAGNDRLIGRGGDDDFVFSSGFGQDEIQENSAASDERDRIVFDATVDRADIRLVTVFDQTRTSDFFIFHDADGSSIFLDDFISGDELENGVREIVFADGTVLALDTGLLLNGGDGADDMGSADQADTLDGGGGDDRLNGMGGADLLIGGAGDDTLSGGNRQNFLDSSNDTLIGGAGNDIMIGRGGDDDFVFSTGFGQDEIRDSNAANGDRDRIVFDATIDPSDIRLVTVFDQTRTSDFFIFHDVDGSSIFLDEFISGDELENGVREIVFADGTVLALDAGLLLNGSDGADDMGSADQADTLDGGGGDDRLNGMGGADLLIGGAGDDTLSGGNRQNFLDSSNDTLIGGTGNDLLIGRGGDDDFVFSVGFGQDEILNSNAANGDRDRIVFDATIHQADIHIRTVNIIGNVSGDLVLEHVVDGSTVTVTGLIDNGGLENGVRVIAFADGTVIDLELGFAQEGTAGNDTLVGLSGADILRGQEGNDRLNGVFGADRLFGGAGDDTLDGGAVVNATDSSDDTLLGGAGDDRLTGRGGDDTFVFGDGDGADTVVDFTSGDVIDLRGVLAISEFADVQARLSQSGADAVIDLGDGDSILLLGVSVASLSASDFLLDPDNATRIVGTEGDDLLIGDSLDNTIDGLGGNDTIDGALGSDLLVGGIGNDAILGETGADTLLGGGDADTLTGSDGDDLLDGGTGNDTYLFSAGFGLDVIVASDAGLGEENRLFFDASINKLDIRLKSFANPDDLGASLVIRHDLGNGEITISDFYDATPGAGFGTLRTGFEILEFADGTIIDLRDGLVLGGESQGEHMRGTNLDDKISSAGGGDEVEGFGGADSLFGASEDDTLDGGDGNDEIFGGLDNDSLFGGDGDDLLEAGLDADTLTGGNGNDRFVFVETDGADVITDFQTGDRIDLTRVSSVGRFAEVLASATQVGSDVLLDLGAGDSITLLGVSRGDLVDTDFLLDPANGSGPDVPTEGDDLLIGDSLDNTIDGLGGNDTIDGAPGNDLLVGGTGNDLVSGDADADTLEGGNGDDTLIGEAGDDTYLFSIGFGIDVVSEVRATAADNDRILFDTSLRTSDIRLTSEASAGGFANLALVDDRDGSIIRAINFIDLDGSFQNGLRFITFDDGTTIDLDAGLALQGAQANERIGGSAADDTVSGGAGNDTLEGRGGENLLQGEAGNDSLIGAGGADTLLGGEGDDILQGNGGDDVLVIAPGDGADTAIGFVDGDRIDLSEFSGISDFSDVQPLLSQNGSNTVLDLGNGDSLTMINVVASTLDADSFIFDPNGGNGQGNGGDDDDDSLTGDADANLIDGGVGNDTLSGLGGNDTLIGGLDDDLLQGGADSDTYRFGAGFGTDEITAEGAQPGDLDRIVFDASVDRADIRITTEGFARLFANLTIVSDADGSVVRHRDFVQLDGQFQNGVRFIEFADGTVIDLSVGLDLQGGSGAERMRGSAISDTIRGGSGEDQLEGGDGDDTLAGEAGDDLLIGEGGDDTYLIGFDTGSNVVSEIGAGTGDRDRILLEAGINPADIHLTTVRQSDGSAHLEVRAGADILASELNFIRADGTLQDGLRLITFDDGTELDLAQGLPVEGTGDDDFLIGTAGDDTLLGLAGADTLEGGAGNDELSGAGGEDTYVFGAGFGADEILILGASALEEDRLFFDASIDRADIRLFSVADPFDLSADLFIQDDADGSTILVSDFYNPNRGGSFGQLRSGFEILEFADGTIIDLRQGFELVGGDGADHMRGPNLNDQLFGLGGADTLEGRNGNDDLFGGDGADELQGGSGDDELFGGAGDDFLFGEGDADTLEGGLGDDTLIGAGGNDTYVFSAGFGADEILSLDASGLEQDRLLFDASIDRADIRLFSVADPFDLSADLFIQDDADGSSILIADFYNPNPGGSFGRLRAGFELLEFADGTIVELRQGLELIGSEDADFMRGPDRDDQLLGLGGDDTLEGHIGDDSLFGGDGGDALLGSSGNDLISGDTGDDTLNGEADDDTLNGGAGADSLAGGAGDDLFILEAGDGVDRIADFAAGALSEDRLDVSALGFTRFQDVQAVATDGAEGVTLALGSGTSVLLEGVLATELDADDLVLAGIDIGPVQRIDPAVDAFIVGAGGQIVVTGVYSTANPVDETLTGIGIRVHFDSSVLQFDGLENLFQPALQPFGQVVEADSSDFDDDAATDSFVALNWADFGGQFPGVGTTPLDLFDILFTGLGDPSDSSINFSASSLALDRNFASTSVDVAADRWPLPDTVSVAENSADGTLIADLAPIPIDPIDPGSFTLLEDAGGRFVLDGFVLRVADGDGLDFEDDASHDISLRITNNAGGSVDRALTVDLTDVNEAPTVVAIDSADIDEDAEAGDQVGTLSALDPEGDIIGFSLIDDAGGRFALDGERLVVAGSGLDFETAPGHSITVRATDTGGLSLDQVLDISVNDVAEATLDLDGDGQVNALTDGLIALGELFGAPLSQLAGLAEPGSPGSDTLVLGDLLDQARAEIFDVDGDGTTDALTDGLMILGHLFGAPQDQVAAFAQPGAIRTDPAEIAAFLDSFVPVEA